MNIGHDDATPMRSREGLILLVIPARRFSTAEGLVNLGSSAFKSLNVKEGLNNPLFSRHSCESRNPGPLRSMA